MSFENIFLISGSLFCLAAAFVTFGIFSRRKPESPLPVLAIYILTLAVSAVYTVIGWNDYDFISPASVWSFLAPLGAAAPVALLIFHPVSSVFRSLLVFLLAAAILLGFDINISFSDQLPLWLSQLLAALLWTAAALSLRIMNGKPALVAAETVSIGFGVLILSLIGAAPFALGLEGACLAAAALAFMFYNWYPPVIELKDSGADLLGFLLGGLLIWCAAEGSGAPAVIFSMLLICETFFALAQKLTFLPRFADLRADTAYARAIASGLTPQVVASHVLRINLLLILFGCFQVYAPNQFSIPLVCAAVTAWQMYRLQNWQTLTSGLRETNRAVIEELKKNFSELKNNFNKTDKPD